MKIYVSGPMRGVSLLNFPAFEAAAEKLRAEGCDVVSPVEMDLEAGTVEVVWDDYDNIVKVSLLEGYDYDQALERDIEAVKDCDAIYMLPGWENSEGAQEELRIASVYGLAIRLAPVGLFSDWGKMFDKAATGGAKEVKQCQPGWLPPEGLYELGRVAGYGADKYAPHNYRLGFPWSSSLNALWRHLLEFQSGNDIDDDSGLPHLAHAAWHCLVLVQFFYDHPELNDRFDGPAAQTEVS